VSGACAVAEKCSFYHRYQTAGIRPSEGRRELEEQEQQTACAQACPAGAILFGDLNNPRHAVHQLAQPDMAHEGKSRNPKAFRLLERLGTHTKVYYLSSQEWVRKAGDNEVKKA
jgi:molybdopterin-containing oxidoreductase family iron-sulfur binding subunit